MSKGTRHPHPRPPAKAAARPPAKPPVESAASAPARPSRRLLLAGAAAVVCGGAGYAAVSWLARPEAPKGPQVLAGDGKNGPAGMAWVPAGEFLMGSDSRMAQPNEKPAHKVRVHGFWMDQHHVTNAEFRRFVEATGYRTTAELKPDWETLKPQLPPGTPRPSDEVLVAGAMVFVGTPAVVDYSDVTRWWRFVPGADWRHPNGPDSHIEGKDDHPVVQVSYEDALAYAKWADKRLPTEAEWEFAARGGLEQATYVWGEDFAPSDKQMANVWQGQQQRRFPVVSAKAGGALGTSPAGTFPANGYGLYDMTGNAWQWAADWYRADQFRRQAAQVQAGNTLDNPAGPQDSFDPSEPGVPVDAPKRVTRGGSFLCNEDFCQSYRPSARRGTDPYTSMSHIGFRLAMDADAWQQQQKQRAASAAGVSRVG